MKILKENLMKDDRGFVALFAVLISAIILSIVVGISNIAYKEAILSSSAREGQYAFFAADSGAECALFGDTMGGFGATTTQPFSCAGVNPIPLTQNSSDNSYDFSFEIDNGPTNLCVVVNVNKQFELHPLTEPGIMYTRIISKGYNVPCAQTTSNDRSVERVIRVTY